MTLPVTERRDGPYSCNGVLTDFDFNFKVFAEDDLEVIFTDSTGADTTLTLTTDYTVSLNADQETNPGGSITTVSVYDTGETVTIIGALSYGQPTQLTNRGGFFPKVIEKALDRLAILVQQLKEIVGRSLTLPASAASGVSTELPAPAALNVIGWNATEDALVNLDSASLASSAAAVDWIAEQFNGTGAQTAYTLSRDPGVAANCDVSISGVTQVPSVDYTVSGTTLTFTAAPVLGTGNICVRYGSALASASAVATDGVSTTSIQNSAVTTAKIAANAVTAAKLDDQVVNDLTTVTPATGDYVMIADVSDSNKKKKSLISAILALISGAITSSGYTMSTSRLLGRSTASTGAIEEITVGTGLTLSGGTLTATGGATLSTTVSINSGSSVNTGSIPAGTKEIVIDFSLLSTNGTANPMIQLGDAGGIESSGYSGSGATNGTTHANNSSGFFIAGSTGAATNVTGTYVLRKIDSAAHTWSISGGGHRADGNAVTAYGQKTLSAELTQFTISTTDTFDGSGVFTYSYR